MRRFKGLEYQRLVIVGANDRPVPRMEAIDRYRTEDPARYRRELRKARSMLFDAATQTRDALTITCPGIAGAASHEGRHAFTRQDPEIPGQTGNATPVGCAGLFHVPLRKESHRG